VDDVVDGACRHLRAEHAARAVLGDSEFPAVYRAGAARPEDVLHGADQMPAGR
jgi:hypothetical protein